VVTDPVVCQNGRVPEASSDRKNRTSVGDIAQTVQMVKDYARQETIDPLRTAGRWIGFGILGSLMIGVATAFLTLGLLRLVQTEWPGTFGGRWTSLVPYLFGLLLCLVVAGLALKRVNKQPLTKEKR
jgi:hypothetical protein